MHSLPGSKGTKKSARMGLAHMYRLGIDHTVAETLRSIGHWHVVFFFFFNPGPRYRESQGYDVRWYPERVSEFVVPAGE
jgi:hypothetical protein